MKLKASQYGLLILVAMVVTRAFLIDEEEVDLDSLFGRNNSLTSASSESAELRSDSYSVQNLTSQANSIVFESEIDYQNFTSPKEEKETIAVLPAASIEEPSIADASEENLLAFNDVASSDGNYTTPIEFQLFAPSENPNQFSEEIEEEKDVSEFSEEPIESIPMDGGSTITEQMSRLFPRR